MVSVGLHLLRIHPPDAHSVMVRTLSTAANERLPMVASVESRSLRDGMPVSVIACRDVPPRAIGKPLPDLGVEQPASAVATNVRRVLARPDDGSRRCRPREDARYELRAAPCEPPPGSRDHPGNVRGHRTSEAPPLTAEARGTVRSG